jgi:predicted TIM-barrel fold metal-dependent hydrolase
MNTALSPATADRNAFWSGPVIDADVHATVPSLHALLPYMPSEWQNYVRERGYSGTVPQVEYTYPSGAPSTARSEWKPDDGRPPASDLELLRTHILDPWDVDHAIVNCYYAVDWIKHPDMAEVIARAVNDWLIAEWLDRDPRLRASLALPGQWPDAMIREIERVGDHPGFVQAFFPVRADKPWGNRLWHGVYAAMADRGLAMNIHFGGTSELPPGPTGWPSYYVEEYAVEQSIFILQLLSLTGEGVFQAVPDLKVVFGEGGFTWVPSISWRMEAKRKGARRDVPWLNQPIYEMLRERVKFTVAPLDAGPPEELARVVEWLGSDEMLMFATDYPHAHEDDIRQLLDALPETARPKLMAENARALYAL